MIKTLGGEADSAVTVMDHTKDNSCGFFTLGLDKFQTVSAVMRQAVQWLTCPMIFLHLARTFVKRTKAGVGLAKSGGRRPPDGGAVHTKAAETLCSVVTLESCKNSLAAFLLGYTN